MSFIAEHDFNSSQQPNNSRLSHLFRLVPNLFWVIVEDADDTSILVRNLMNRAGLSERSVLLHAKTPKDFKLTKKVSSNILMSKLTLTIFLHFFRIHIGQNQGLLLF